MMAKKYCLFLCFFLLFYLEFVNSEKEPQESNNLKSEDVLDLVNVVSTNPSNHVENKPVTSAEYQENLGDFEKPKQSVMDRLKTPNKDLGFIHAFIASVSVIVVSELGDKTFFIAAIMAMRHSRITVFLGAITALAVMTILSACLGFATTIIPRKYTYYISTALFAIFGLKMLKEGYYMSPTEGQEEYEEVQADLRKREDELEKQSMTNPDVESGARGSYHKPSVVSFISKIFIQAFTLTFLAEWGDRSQLTTIILAAREDAFGVTLGGIVGHGLCTALAVVGGRIVAQRISVRTVTLIGGIVFLVFALSSLIVDF